jgi:hypothetical protein
MVKNKIIDNINDLERLVKDRLCLKHINIDENINKNINKVLPIIMETVEFSNKSGNEKKQMTIDIFKNLINKSSLNDNIKNITLDAIDSDIFSQSIDMVVNIARENLNINITKHSFIKKICNLVSGLVKKK